MEDGFNLCLIAMFTLCIDIVTHCEGTDKLSLGEIPLIVMS